MAKHFSLPNYLFWWVTCVWWFVVTWIISASTHTHYLINC